ncbi:MAG: transposase family protein [Deltaproteobacteria bacterium]|nr:transposase family protein [Deltaproteobacteria bacterium]
MIDLSQLETASPGRIHALFGLSPTALSELLEAVLPELLKRRRTVQESRPDRQRAVGGGRTRRLKPYQEVLLTLLYLRHNVSQAVVGALFGVSADTSENTFHEVIAVLKEVCPSSRWEAEKRWKKSLPSWQPEDLDRVLLDSFETPIQRPSDPDRQKRAYSGKRKAHTTKTQVATDGTGEVLDIDPGHRGPKADIRLYEESQIHEKYPNADKVADKAYQSQEHPELITPHKKPKGGQLTPEQIEENTTIAKERIYVEHAIRRIKAFRIVRQDFRLALGLYPMIAHAVVGLVQLGRIIG